MMRTPAETIQAQLEAYNRHDIEAFMAVFNPQATLYNLVDGSVIASGQEAIRDRYMLRFANPHLHAEITQRMVMGARVIDHERVSGIQADRDVEVIAIYDVQDGLIQQVWFIYE
jgi:hypothetical protein